MNSAELSYFNNCKRLIEQKLGWQESTGWKQRDYLSLIDLIENKTGITLSLSTIRRIWKSDFTGTPHPATLEALALFLGYKSWLEFKSQNPLSSTDSQTDTFRSTLITRHKKSFATLITIVLLTSCLSLFFGFFQSGDSREIVYDPNDIIFNCSNSVALGVPNTVIFNFDVNEIEADSFFIQQSWSQYERERIQKADKNLSCTYYYPGYHNAKLIANDSVVREIGVQVNTDDWLSLARNSYIDRNPVYIHNDDVIAEGLLNVSIDHLYANKVDIKRDLMVSHFYVDNFNGLSSADFSLSTRVKCDSIINSSCPDIAIIVLGQRGGHFIPLVTKACVGETMVKFGDNTKYGKNNDLSALGVDVYEWHEVELRAKDNKGSIYLNGQLIYELPFIKDCGEVVGISFNFTGASGSVDYVNLKDGRGQTVHESDFDVTAYQAAAEVPITQ